jgi:aspartyl-tRNA(Asn)/glutamyl-tRNA(Gln) amidotransferase subunit B
MRDKEDAHDYRYYPDGNIPGLALDDAYINSLRESMPEPPDARRARYTDVYQMSKSDADTILARKAASDFFDAVVALGAEPRDALNLVRGVALRHMGDTGEDTIRARPEDAARLLRMGAAGEVGAANVKKAMGLLMRGEGGTLDAIISSDNMLIREDPELLAAVVREALASNPAAVTSYKAGETKVFGYFMGQCNKVLKGAADPQTLRNELKKQLDNI